MIGNIIAQCKLGCRNYYGNDIIEKYTPVTEAYMPKKYTTAQYFWGYCYMLEQEHNKYRKWIEIAAGLGDSRAQFLVEYYER